MMKNVKPFNLDRALAGDPVVTRDGQPVIQITYFEKASDLYPIRALLQSTGNILSWTKEGNYSHMVNALTIKVML